MPPGTDAAGGCGGLNWALLSQPMESTLPFGPSLCAWFMRHMDKQDLGLAKAVVERSHDLSAVNPVGPLPFIRCSVDHAPEIPSLTGQT